MQKAYQKLKERFADIANLEHIGGILGKDAETVLAEGSENDRVEKMKVLGKLSHMLIAGPEVSTWLDEAEADSASLSPADRKNLELMRKQWIHEASLSEKMAADVAELGSEGELRHRKNFKSGDWASMKDWYVHSFTLMREVAHAKQKELGTSTPYEALLDVFNPGVDVALVKQEFTKLGATLAALIPQALAKQDNDPAPLPLTGPFPAEQQRELCMRIAKAVGFNFTRGRLDFIDGHPSTGGSPDDSRITTHIDENSFIPALYSTAHEAGHGMYEQNLPEEWRYQIAGTAQGMNIHETQSMIIEKEACKTPEFFAFLEEQTREVFNRPHDPALSAENLERIVNHAERSFIRIDADDLTYPVHVILRFEIEQAVIDGEAEPEDIPQIWNTRLKELLGVTPPNPSKGHMQDVHWPIGLIGYFPAYTLGAMGAAQFFAAACHDRPEICPEIRKGNFTPLNEWLHDNVHSKGRFLSPDELFIQATGKKLGADDYLDKMSRAFLGKPLRGPSTGPSPAPRPF